MDNLKALQEFFKSSAHEKEFRWLEEKLNQDLQRRKLSFVMVPRFISSEPTGKGEIAIGGSAYKTDLRGWTLDQVARAILLLSMDQGDSDSFEKAIETLFMTADNREAEAIYKSIPLFPYPSKWEFRATEAIRSNVGLIRDAMIFNNPYPALYFDENAWNQMILKTIFSDKSLWDIIGLADRRNKELARAISDFAHERWAAGRTLSADVWFLTEIFEDRRLWEDADTLLGSDSVADQKAGYLLWKINEYKAPKPLTNKYKTRIDSIEILQPQWRELDENNH